ncbi:MAG: hypothetical protein AAFQ98_00395 [Bacteroidota bacterium]
MQDWYLRPLVFNDSLPMLLPNEAEPIDTLFDWFPDPGHYYIVRQIDASCGKCIGQMEQAQAFLDEYSEVKNLHFILIASAPISDMAQSAVNQLSLSYPVFFQQNHEEFRKANELPLNDDLFTNMLVNGQGEVLLFGDVLLNDLTEELFLSIVQGECGF